MPLDAETWNDRYLRRDMGWDKGRCAPPIARMLAEGVVPKTARLAVVGAGRGFEALEASRVVDDVTAIDFAPEAVKAMEALQVASGRRFTPLLADVLALHQTHPRSFDAILEHTCYCAIDPSQRDAYVTAVTGALRPGGMVFGLFYNHGRTGGPPFDTPEADVRARFSPFTVERFVKANDSFPGRAGEEWEFVFRLKG